MSRDERKALEDIARLCAESPNITGRQIRIYEVALHGLGFTQSQRDEKMRDQIQAIRDKIQERRDRKMAAQQAGVKLPGHMHPHSWTGAEVEFTEASP